MAQHNSAADPSSPSLQYHSSVHQVVRAVLVVVQGVEPMVPAETVPVVIRNVVPVVRKVYDCQNRHSQKSHSSEILLAGD